MLFTRVSSVALTLADSVMMKTDSDKGKRIGERVEGLKDELQKLNDALRRAIANKDAEEIRDLRSEIANVEADIKKRSRSDDAKADASGSVVVDKNGKVVSASGGAGEFVKVGEKLTSTALDELTEAGFSVREKR